MIPESANEWVLRGRAVVTPEGVRPAAVVVRGETIAAVVGSDDVGAGVPVADVGDKLILPGLVDTHVHINEPGRTDWEGFETATRAAAAGGITTLIDMPLNSSPVTTTVAALEAKRQAAGRQAVGRCRLSRRRRARQRRAHPAADPRGRVRVQGVPVSFRHRRISERHRGRPAGGDADPGRGGDPAVRPRGVGEPAAAGRRGTFRSEPAELPGLPGDAAAGVGGRRDSADDRVCAASTGVRCISCTCRRPEQAKPLIKKAKAEGLPFTVETCPHYLTFAAGEFLTAIPLFKCAPPIRSREPTGSSAGDGRGRADRHDRLGSLAGPAGDETLDRRRPAAGLGRDRVAPVAAASRLGRHSATYVGRAIRSTLLTTHPAALVGLAGRKGAIAPGHDADFVVFDPGRRIHGRGRAFCIIAIRRLHTSASGSAASSRRRTCAADRSTNADEILGGPGGRTLRREASAKRR